MTLIQGRSYLAIPGPSVIPDAVLQAMHRASPNIYEGELVDLTMTLFPDLKRIAGTVHDVAIYIGNGHAAWEAALVNTHAPGDRVLVAATGHFAHGWADMAEGLGIEVELLDFSAAQAVDPQQVADVLRADTDGRIKSVLAVHVDTSTSVKTDIAELNTAIRATGHDALFMVDCIASMGCDAYDMDGWGAEVTVAACQKGLMTPAGLAFVWFNDRARARRAALPGVSRYWDWTPRARPDLLWQAFDGTAPTHHLYGLRKALDLMLEEGLDHVAHRHGVIAQAVWAAIEAWGAPMALGVTDPARRSHAVTTVHLPDGNAQRLQDWCVANTGVTLGIGLGRDPAEDYFRIGHMGHVNAHMIMGALGAIEMGLIALDIPHGDGALSAAARVLSRG